MSGLLAFPAAGQITAISCGVGTTCCGDMSKKINCKHMGALSVDDPDVIEFLETALWSDKDWHDEQLHNLPREFMRAGKYEDAVTVFALMDQRGRLKTAEDMEAFASALEMSGQPHRAALRLERGMDEGLIKASPQALRRISDLYLLARDRENSRRTLHLINYKDLTMSEQITLARDLAQAEDCDAAETRMPRNKRSEATDEAWSHIGVCWFNRADAAPRLSCNMTDEQVEQSERHQAYRRALSAYENVTFSDARQREAEMWISIIRDELDSFDRRCGWSDCKGVEKELCYLQWEQAYRATIFSDKKLEVKDDFCLKYKDEYDAKYVKKLPKNR